MAEFGLTPQGFNLKRLQDILADLKAELEEVVDPDTGESLQVNFDDNDPLINLVNAVGGGLEEIWLLLEAVNRNFDPASATAATLSALVQINGIRRKTGSYSTIAIDLTGTPGTIIPAGQQISDFQQNIIYETDEEITLDGAGLASSTATATIKAPFLNLSGTVTTILTPVSGWATVTNPTDSTIGAGVEDDPTLRARRNRSTESPSVSPVEATYGALSNLDGVLFVRVYVNNTLLTDVRGIPAKTVAAVVQGGDDDEIAQTIFLRNAMGVGYYGNTTIVVTDLQGEPYQVRFTRPDPVDVQVVVDIAITNVGEFPSDGADRIKAAIVAYSQQGRAGVGIDEGFEDFGFVPGVNVTLSRLYTPINSVPGHKVTNLQIAKLGDPLGTADIPIGIFEYARIDSSNITVNLGV